MVEPVTFANPTAAGSAAVILSTSVDVQKSLGTPEFVCSWIRQRVALELLSSGHLNIIGQKPAWTMKVGCLDLSDSPLTTALLQLKLQDLQMTAKISTHLLNIGFGTNCYFIFAFEHAADCEEWSTKITERYMLVVTTPKPPMSHPSRAPAGKHSI